MIILGLCFMHFMHAYVAFWLTSPFLSYLSSISTSLPPLYQIFDSICMPDLSWCKLASCAQLLPSKDGCILFKYRLWRPPWKFSLHSPWDFKDLPQRALWRTSPFTPDLTLLWMNCVVYSVAWGSSSLLVADATQSLGRQPAMRLSLIKQEI